MTEEFSAHSILQDHGQAIAAAVARRKSVSGESQVTVLKTSAQAVTMRIEIGGKQAIVKAFAPGASASGFVQEQLCFSALTGTDLAPRLIDTLPQALCLVMKPVEGTLLSDALTPRNLPAYARQLGLWYRRFSTQMPAERAEGDWWGYLARYEDGALAARLEEHRNLLEGLPLTRSTVARNDAHFSNFIVTPKAELVGYDFETAQVKPLGWDVLLTARSLARMFPGRLEHVLPPLLDGWYGGRAKKNRVLDPRLVKLFAEVTGFPG